MNKLDGLTSLPCPDCGELVEFRPGYTHVCNLRKDFESAMETTSNPIEHPDHYNRGGIEVIDFIHAWDLGFTEGCVVKYMCRWQDKGGIEDLKKARFYLDLKIQKLEEEQSDTSTED